MIFKLSFFKKALAWRTRRAIKYCRQFFLRPRMSPMVLFIVGCQRSGTNMLMSVLDKSPDTWIYNESNPRAFDNYRIRSLAQREKLLKISFAWVVFKALADSHNINQLLAEHPQGKAIWIYRHYQDVANSAVEKWGSGQLALIRLTATQPDWQYWLVEKMSVEQRVLVQKLYSPTMTEHSAAALKWYLRNTIFFDYHLEAQPERVRLVKYEALVTSPAHEFEQIARFLPMTFNSEYIAHVRTSSLRKNVFPPIDPQVQALCEDLQDRLDRFFQQQVTLQ